MILFKNQLMYAFLTLTHVKVFSLATGWMIMVELVILLNIRQMAPKIFSP